MKNFDEVIKKWKHTPSYFLHFLLFRLNPFLFELGYFVTLSSVGFLALKSTSSNPARKIDLFFTSASAVTVSSMSTLEMEVLSTTHLVILTVLMLLGGEVFTSMLHLRLTKAKLNNNQIRSSQMITEFDHSNSDVNTKRKYCIDILASLVTWYLVAVHAVGSASIVVYLSLVPSARRVLERKGIGMGIFSVFTAVSTFANCGFVPTNENMIVFKKNSGLLLSLIPLVFMGNTLYPVCLRLLIWFTEKVTKRAELRYVLENSRELGYGHLMPGLESVYLGITVLGFVVVQMIVFSSLEWNNNFFGVSNYYERIVGCLFQVVNSRHAGESVFDLGAVSPAVLVLFVIMMYLPPYTSYLPINEHQVAGENITKDINTTLTSRNKVYYKWENIVFSQLTYLSIFVILICITERRNMKTDPINFNVLNIVVEVISAYGNVGFSVGYSCEKQMHYSGGGAAVCKNAWYGFAGRWSDEGKFVLIVVMFIGRLKKFNMRGGRAWILA
ncbi:hypothetical protein ABFX02_10G075000 [Erythranthe guttata]